MKHVQSLVQLAHYRVNKARCMPDTISAWNPDARVYPQARVGRHFSCFLAQIKDKTFTMFDSTASPAMLEDFLRNHCKHTKEYFKPDDTREHCERLFQMLKPLVNPFCIMFDDVKASPREFIACRLPVSPGRAFAGVQRAFLLRARPDCQAPRQLGVQVPRAACLQVVRRAVHVQLRGRDGRAHRLRRLQRQQAEHQHHRAGDPDFAGLPVGAQPVTERPASHPDHRPAQPHPPGHRARPRGMQPALAGGAARPSQGVSRRRGRRRGSSGHGDDTRHLVPSHHAVLRGAAAG